MYLVYIVENHQVLRQKQNCDMNVESWRKD